MKIKRLNLSRTEQKAVNELKDRLAEKLGDRLRLFRLYGSKARGDARPDSDIDILIVIDKDDFDIKDTVSKVVYDVYQKYDYRYFLSVKVMGQEHYDLLASIGTTFFRNLEKDGIDLWKRE